MYLMDYVLKEYMNRERLRVPLPPLPPPRPDINNHIYNNIMHDMIRSSDRLGVPVHDRLTIGRIPVKEDRRKIRRRRKIIWIHNVFIIIIYKLLYMYSGRPKTKVQESITSNANSNGSNRSTTQIPRSRNKKRQSLKQK